MKDFFLLIPIIFFIISIILRFMDNSIELFRKYGIEIHDKIVWTIPLSQLKDQIKFSNDENRVKDFKRCLIIRLWHFCMLILCFVSVIGAAYVQRFFSHN